MKRTQSAQKTYTGTGGGSADDSRYVADCAGRRLGVCQYIFPALPDIGADQGQ